VQQQELAEQIFRLRFPAFLPGKRKVLKKLRKRSAISRGSKTLLRESRIEESVMANETATKSAGPFKKALTYVECVRN